MTSKDDEVSEQNAIPEMVFKAEPGEVFVSSDFAGAGSADVVRKAFSSLEVASPFPPTVMVRTRLPGSTSFPVSGENMGA